jgi:hypothetical protein
MYSRFDAEIHPRQSYNDAVISLTLRLNVHESSLKVVSFSFFSLVQYSPSANTTRVAFPQYKFASLLLKHVLWWEE